MTTKLFVPKFVTIEDKLAGILTFRQLFALLGAFLLSFFVFKMNQFLGFLTALISFALAFIFTFVYINGKPVLNSLPKIIDFFFKSRRFAWQRIEKTTYKEITVPKELTNEINLPKIPQRKITNDRAEITLEYPETNIKEKLTISLKEPIASQTEKINDLVHHHLLNPKNPYRFFPYVKFFRTLK